MRLLGVLLRLVVMIIQLAAVMVFFTDGVGWGLWLAVPLTVLVVLLLPFVGAVLAIIGAIQVWLWPWWLALLVFLPGLVLSLLALFGVGTAGALSWWLLRRRLPTAMQQAQQHAAQDRQARSRPVDDVIEGEVLDSRLDDDPPPR